jgi:hypothetical protein
MMNDILVQQIIDLRDKKHTLEQIAVTLRNENRDIQTVKNAFEEAGMTVLIIKNIFINDGIVKLKIWDCSHSTVFSNNMNQIFIAFFNDKSFQKISYIIEKMQNVTVQDETATIDWTHGVH